MPFCNVTGAEADIQDIVCTDDGAQPAGGAFQIAWWDQKLGYQYGRYLDDSYAHTDDEGGEEYTDKMYWCTDDDDMYILVPKGWQHDPEAPATIYDHEKKFKVGEGFYIAPESLVTKPKVTVAGAVASINTSDEFMTMDSVGGKRTMHVNPFGAAYDIQEVKCFDGDVDPAGGAFQIAWWDQKLGYQYGRYLDDSYAHTDDEGGEEYTDKMYWCTDDDDMYILVPIGWKHDPDAPATIYDHEKKFAVGEGFFIAPESLVSDPKVGFANPFYVAK